MGGDGVDDMIDIVVADGRGIGRKNSAEGVDGSKFHGRETKVIVGIKVRRRRWRPGSKFSNLFLTGRSGEERFGSKGEREMWWGRGLDTKLREERFSFGGGEDGDVVDCGKKGTDIFALWNTKTAAEWGGAGVWFDVGDIGPIGGSVRLQTETKERVGASNADRFVVFRGKRWGGKRKIGGRIEGIRIGGNGLIFVDSLEMTNIWGKVQRGEIIHTLVEAYMEGDFDAIGIGIIPENVFLSMGEVTKEDSTFSGAVLKASFSLAGRADPNTSAKSAKFAKLRFMAGMKPLKGRGTVAFGREAIFDSEIVIKSIGPEAWVKVGSRKHGTECVANGLVGAFDGAVLMGGIGARWVNGVVEFFEEGNDERVLVELSTLIKDDIFIIDVGRMLDEPIA
jgi:hypothetical protein